MTDIYVGGDSGGIHGEDLRVSRGGEGLTRRQFLGAGAVAVVGFAIESSPLGLLPRAGMESAGGAQTDQQSNELVVVSSDVNRDY